VPQRSATAWPGAHARRITKGPGASSTGCSEQPWQVEYVVQSVAPLRHHRAARGGLAELERPKGEPEELRPGGGAAEDQLAAGRAEQPQDLQPLLKSHADQPGHGADGARERPLGQAREGYRYQAEFTT